MNKYLHSILILFLILNKSFGQSKIIVNNITSLPESDVSLSVFIDNQEQFSSFQFDLCYPDQLEWKNASQKLGKRASDHVLSVQKLEKGRLRVVVYSPSSKVFKGKEGEVFQTIFKSGKIPGIYQIKIENATVVSKGKDKYSGFEGGKFSLNAPLLRILKNKIDFERVPLNEQRKRTLSFENVGNEELIVSSIQIDNSVYTLSSNSLRIPVGTSKDLDILFQSNKKGITKSTLQITTNDAFVNYQLNVKADVFAVNEIHIGNISSKSGQFCHLPIQINNMEEFSAFQCTIELPEVVKYNNTNIIKNINRFTDHVVEANLNGQKLKILAYSPTNKNFKKQDGDIVSIPLQITGERGDYNLKVSNALMSNSRGENILSEAYDGNLNVKSPRIYISNKDLNFGKVSSLERGSISLEINNYGNDQLIVDDIIFEDEHFSTDEVFPISINSWQEKNIIIHFKADDKKRYKSFLTIKSNDVTNNPLLINVQAESYRENQLAVVDLYTKKGIRDFLYVELNNRDEISGFQFDVELPEGIQPNLAEVVLSDRKKNHSVLASSLGNHIYRVISWSGDLSAFEGVSGNIIKIPIDVSSSLAVTNEIKLSNVVISNCEGKSVESTSKNGSLIIGLDLGEVDYNVLSKKLLNTKQSMDYRFNNEQWITCTDGETKNVNFKEGELQIRERNRTENFRIIHTFKRPAAPQFHIDFKKEVSVEVIPKNIIYSFQANFEDQINGNEKVIDLEPNQQIYFQKKATNRELSSSVFQLNVPSRPILDLPTIDYEKESTNHNISSSLEYSTDNFESNVQRGSDKIMNLDPGQNIYFRQLATATSFVSDIKELIVKERPQKPQVHCNYKDLLTHEIINSDIEYSCDEDFLEDCKVGVGLKINLKVGETYYFRKRASNTQKIFRSEIFTLQVSEKPTAPFFTINYVDEIINEPITSDIEFCENESFAKEIKLGEGQQINVKPGEDLWFRVAQTEHFLAGEIFHLIIPNRPNAPLVKEQDDERDLFDWEYIEGYGNTNDYEYSVDRGNTWNRVDEKPLRIGNKVISKGDLQIRLAAKNDKTNSNFVGIPLLSSIDYSVITGITDVSCEVHIYPNPVKDFLKIEQIQSLPCNMTLYNIAGRKVISKKIVSGCNELDLQKLPDGMYILQLITKDKKITRKIIKTK